MNGPGQSLSPFVQARGRTIFGELVHWPTMVTLVLAPVIVFAYVRLARREEVTLSGRFGAAYATYRQRVPMFIPRPRR